MNDFEVGDEIVVRSGEFEDLEARVVEVFGSGTNAWVTVEYLSNREMISLTFLAHQLATRKRLAAG